MRYHNILSPISFAALVCVSTFAHAQDNPPSPDKQLEAVAQPSAAPEAVHIDDQHGELQSGKAKQTRLLSGYGNGGFSISTSVPEAQAFFSNGMELGAAFAHQPAIDAMQEAVRLDPDCAMCLWGEAFMSGPTLNYGSNKDERKPLFVLARKASKLARDRGSPLERDLTRALIRRYTGGDVHKRDKAFHSAMELLAARYPDNDMVQVLTADASLVAANEDDEWKPAAVRAMELLEPVLARSPQSTPAIHFYIHSSEIAGQSAKAEPFADRLADLAPRASHLVHMPSHTWYWLGRYQEAADTNLRAVRIDQDNAALMGHDGEHGVFKLPYHAHNVIFGLGGAMMAEDSRTALTLARPLVASTHEREEGSPIMQLLSAAGYFALARFDDPASTLALSEPKLPYLKVAWHYARGEAYAFQKNKAGLAKEIAAIADVKIDVDDIDADDSEESPAPDQMIGIVREVLTGRLAMMEGRHADAANAFRNAAEIEETEDFSVFADPPAFWYPVRRDLAAALFAQGDMDGGRIEAEATLKLRPKDPVTLALLADAFGPAGQSANPIKNSQQLEEAIAESHRALEAILNGDPSKYLALFADRDDITLGNPFGPFGKGREQVAATLANAANKYQRGSARVERVSLHGNENFAGLVEIEHDRAQLTGSDEYSEFSVRVTSVYKRIGGQWKLVHRHADPITTSRSAASVIGK